MWRIAVTALALFVILGSAAQAATVESRTLRCAPLGYDPAVFFTARPGETNDVSFSVVEGRGLLVRDRGAPIEPGGCEPYEDGVLCRFGAGGVIASLGDGADRFDGTGTPGAITYTLFHVDGGDGDDALLGGPAFDILLGGRGRDTLAGAGDGDILAGDGGAYFFVGEPQPPSAQLPTAENDRIDGGPGDSDALTYSARRTPVRVDLSDPSAPAGSEGEADVLSGIEWVTGGRGDDLLRGDEGRNFLSGGLGADLVSGRGGPDLLEGGQGRDRLFGGAGRDELHPLLLHPNYHTPKDAADLLACGAGTGEKADRIRPDDVVQLDCERPYVGCFCALRLRPLASTASSPMSLKLPRGGRVELRLASGAAAGRLLAHRSGKVTRDGERRRLWLLLSRPGRKLLTRRRALRVRVTISRPRGITRVFQTTLRAPP